MYNTIVRSKKQILINFNIIRKKIVVYSCLGINNKKELIRTEIMIYVLSLSLNIASVKNKALYNTHKRPFKYSLNGIIVIYLNSYRNINSRIVVLSVCGPTMIQLVVSLVLPN